MTTWNLALFPANVNNQNQLFHVWSNGENWANPVPVVVSPKDDFYIVIYSANKSNSDSFVGLGAEFLVPLDNVTGDAELSVIGNSPFSDGSASLVDGAWRWPSPTGTVSFQEKGFHQFTVTVQIDGESYTCDPTMIVKEG